MTTPEDAVPDEELSFNRRVLIVTVDENGSVEWEPGEFCDWEIIGLAGAIDVRARASIVEEGMDE